jgi:CheY-like chemotaxis protein
VHSLAKILVIDDEPQMRRLLREALVRAGYSVDEACDGLHALVCFANQRPDLVITDIIMPNREGIETIQTIHQKSPSVPIIAISGGGRQNPYEYLSIAARIGANRTFAKPFRLDELLVAVGELTAASIE